MESHLAQMLSQLSVEDLKEKGIFEPEHEKVLGSLNLDGLAEYIESGKAKNVIVMAGAGISVSAGIPDFRTPGTGLYDNLQKYSLPHPQAIFEIDFFQANPSAFYLLAKEMWAEGVAAGKYKPTPAHNFIKLLHDKGVLLRCYTQNIDSLEAEAGLPADKLVAAHGNFDSATCIATGKAVPAEEVKQAVIHGKDGEQGWGEEGLMKKYGGLCKPDIVFFGEGLPARFFKLMQQDFPQCDLLIVMGTSLAVQPFAGLMHKVRDNCPRVLINRDPVGLRSPEMRPDVKAFQMQMRGNPIWIGEGFRFEMPDINYRDVALLGSCDDQVVQLASKIGWDEDLSCVSAAPRDPLDEAFERSLVLGDGPRVGEERLGVTVRAVHTMGECSLVIAQGSVVDFEGDAIVNAANTGGLGGGGVDGAVSRAGGAELAKARQALPVLGAGPEDGPPRVDMFGRGIGARIRTGGAVTTIGGALKARYVVHAVGPAYSNETNWPEEDSLLRSAYTASVEQAMEKGCETLGFSLLSAGIFRGGRSLETVLGIGCEAVRNTAAAPLKEVYLVGFMPAELEVLVAAAEQCFETSAEHTTAPEPSTDGAEAAPAGEEAAEAAPAGEEAAETAPAQEVEVPGGLVCPITDELMLDPVLCADGHSYERANIQAWLENHDTSPLTGVALEHKSLVPNHALRKVAEEWQNANLPCGALQ